jgi:hypothetical protein
VSEFNSLIFSTLKPRDTSSGSITSKQPASFGEIDLILIRDWARLRADTIY